MADESEVRVQRAFAHVAPSRSADADLAGALATAVPAPAPSTHRSLWIGVAAAAAIIAAIGVVVVRREPAGRREPTPIVAAPLDGRTARAQVDAGGIVVLDDLRGAPLVTVELGGTPVRASDGLAEIERFFTRIATAADRDERGAPNLALELVPSPKAKWLWIQWILQSAASPGARLNDIRFRMDGSDAPSIEQRLPMDRGLVDAPIEDVVGIEVSLTAGTRAGAPVGPGGSAVTLSQNGSRFGLHIESSDTSIGADAIGFDSTMAKLSAALRAVANDEPRVAGEIAAPPPRGYLVPYDVVFAVLRAFREAGIDDVHFRGAAGPKPQEGTSAR